MESKKIILKISDMNNRLLNIKILLLFFLFLLINCSLDVCGQGFDIKVITNNLQYDSLHIQSFDGKKKYVNIYSIKCADEVVFKGKKVLSDGIYYIAGDTMPLTHFFISSPKNQKFSIIITDSSTSFVGSEENESYMRYLDELKNFDRQMELLNEEFEEMKSSNFPPYMMQVYVDSLVVKAKNIDNNKRLYQEEKVKQFAGSIVSSVILASVEMVPPPKSYYQDRILFYRYAASHIFDRYPWHDERLNQTSIAVSKFTNFGNILYQLDFEEGRAFLKQFMDSSKVSEKTYYKFFDILEHILGSITSPYKVEGLYIEMLKDMLTYPNLETARKLRYELELSRIDKNLEGTKLPNFKLLMENGDSTDFYSINSDYVLLYFQNPDCPTCTQTRERMANFSVLNNAINQKKIVVLTVFFEENDALWRKYLKNHANPSYRHGWNWDLQIEKEELFDTRTIPFMFLVDKNKVVIKKDILINEIEDRLKVLGL